MVFSRCSAFISSCGGEGGQHVVACHFNGPPGESVVKLHMPLVDNTCDAGGWRSRPYMLRGHACLLRKHASVCKKCCVLTGVQQ